MKSSTVVLRRMLDDRRVKWKKHDLDPEHATMWHASDGTLVSASQIHGKRVTLFWDLTPEQAIAATLESDGEYERKMDALLCRLTNGKFSKTRIYDLDFMESVVREEFETECVSEPGTCQMKILWSNIDAGACFECSACGGIVSTFGPEPRFCSKCGCRVEAVVK